MRRIPIDCDDDAIRELIIEWNELLAEEKYVEALNLFPYSKMEFSWTPGSLKNVINGYGVVEPDKATLKNLLEEYEVEEFVISSLLGRDDKGDIIENCIVIDREHLYELDPRYYLGMAHYNDVPLSGYRSDLTARFHIKKIGEGELTLEFLDLHVM